MIHNIECDEITQNQMTEHKDKELCYRQSTTYSQISSGAIPCLQELDNPI
jgi:hypothetical protein